MEEFDFLQILDALDDVNLAVKVLDEGGLIEEAGNELLKRYGPTIIVFLFRILLRPLIIANIVLGFLDRLFGYALLNSLTHLSDLQQQCPHYRHRVVELLHVEVDEGAAGRLLQEHVVEGPP